MADPNAKSGDPFLQGYGDSYEGYGGQAPNFNRHFGEIKSPPQNGDNPNKKPKLPSMPNFPNFGAGFLKLPTNVGDLNYYLLISKTFYFFFFAAFGSLFPLIAVYFKQIGMNPSQSGALIGFRPFVEFFSAPFWGNFADKYKKWKQILLFSLLCWIGFTLGLAFVKPPPYACLTYNTTHVILVPPWSDEAMNIDPDHPYDTRGGNRRKREIQIYEKSINIDPHDIFASPNAESVEFNPKGQQTRQKRDIHYTYTALDEPKPNDTSYKSLYYGHKDDDYNEDSYNAFDTFGADGQDIEDAALDFNVFFGRKKRSAEYTDGDLLAMDQERSKRDSESKPKNKDKPKKDIEVDAEGQLDLDNKPSGTLDEYNLENKIRSISDLLPYPKIVIYGKSPLPLDHTKITNVDKEDVEGLVSPPFSSVVYKASEVQKMFWLILFLMMIGEFFSAPAITLADSATLGYLEEDVENYGKQRMFGSLGWGLAMFFVGIALDQADVFADHPCGYKQKVERNYMVCFAVFTVLMTCAFLAATKFKFKDGDDFNKESIKLKHLKQMKDKVIGKVKDAYDASRGFGRQQMQDTTNSDQPTIYNQQQNGYDQNYGTDTTQPPKKVEIKLDSTHTADMVTDATEEAETTHGDVVTRPTPFVPRGKPGQSGRLPEWVSVLKLFGNSRIGSMLFLTWFMGFGVGLVFTFLFWHLQDLHGTPTLFGIASVINHISEILAYFFSKKLINAIGHVKVLYLGLLGNVLRFLYVSYLRQPWSVLPFELLQGLTHAAVWAACCSYITQSTPTHLRATAQGILQGIHHGLGRGCGSVIGGILVYFYGTEHVFRGYGITCLIVLALYAALNFFYIRKLPIPEAEQDSKEFVEEGMHLAPCGVPMGMNRNLSSSMLQSMGDGNANNSAPAGDIRSDPSYGYGSDSFGGSVVLPTPPRPNTDARLQQPMTTDGYGYDIR